VECDILDVISHVVINAVKECINVKNICGNFLLHWSTALHCFQYRTLSRQLVHINKFSTNKLHLSVNRGTLQVLAIIYSHLQ